jgi:enamine deaminase RidA (YjgF/YER057c/UK114 family)
MNERVSFRAQGAPPPAGPYSHAIRSGGLLFLSGQGPFRPNGSKVEGPFEEQARQTLRNLEAVAAGASASLVDAVRVAVYLRDMSNFAADEQGLLRILPRPSAGPDHNPIRSAWIRDRGRRDHSDSRLTLPWRPASRRLDNAAVSRRSRSTDGSVLTRAGKGG